MSTRVTDARNVFRTRWTLRYKNGNSEKVTDVNLRLRCRSFWEYIPFYACPADKILLDDSNGST